MLLTFPLKVVIFCAVNIDCSVAHKLCKVCSHSRQYVFVLEVEDSFKSVWMCYQTTLPFELFFGQGTLVKVDFRVTMSNAPRAISSDRQ